MDKLEESFKEMVMKPLEDYIKWMESLMTPKQIKEAKRKK